MSVETDRREDRPESREDSNAYAPRGVKLELMLLVCFSAVWLFAVLGLFKVLPVAGVLELDLYRLYSVAAVLGWLSGNVYILRRRSLPKGGRWKKRLLLAYLLGPPGVVYLLRALAPVAIQNAAPFVPIYSFLVYVIFFLVPVTLRAPDPPRKPLSG